MSLLTNMPHKSTISRPTFVREGVTSRETLNSVSTKVKCWVQNAGRALIVEFEKRDENVTHRVFFPTDPGLEVGDYITVTHGPSFVGQVFKFIAAADRSAGLGKLFGAICEVER